MDAVRRSLYSSMLKQVLKNPPQIKVLVNYLHYKIETFLKRINLSSLPLSVVLYTNKRCNFSCSFCYNQDVLNTSNVNDDDMTYDEFVKIMNSSFGQNALRVAFMGGEPFLNSQIFRFIDYAFTKGKVTNVLTNASVLKGKIMKQYLESPLNVLGVSLYDNNREDVARVVSTLNKNKKIYWVQTVANAQNLQGLEDSILFCYEIGCKNLILSNYNPYFENKIENMIQVNNREYSQLEFKLKKIIKNKINIQWINRVDLAVKQSKTCRLPFSYAHIDNKGSLGPCCFRYPEKKKYGSIYSKESWNSKSFQKLRMNLMDKKMPAVDHCENCENLRRDLYGL